MRNILYILSVCSALLLSSCIKDMDLEQTKQLVFEPTMAVSLMNFNLKSNDFVNRGVVVDSFSKSTNFEVLKNENLQKQIKRIQFNIEVDNSLGRNFEISLRFLDGSGNVVFDKLDKMNVQASHKFKKSVEILLTTEDEFFTARYMDVKVKMLGGGILNATSPDGLKFKSSAIVYMKI